MQLYCTANDGWKHAMLWLTALGFGMNVFTCSLCLVHDIFRTSKLQESKKNHGYIVLCSLRWWNSISVVICWPMWLYQHYINALHAWFLKCFVLIFSYLLLLQWWIVIAFGNWRMIWFYRQWANFHVSFCLYSCMFSENWLMNQKILLIISQC